MGVHRLVKHLVIRGVRCASNCPGKAERTDLFATPHRTHHRVNSPRLAASGPQNKVGKGSQQHGSVISGKAFALWVVFRVPVLRTEMLESCLTLRSVEWTHVWVTIDGQGVLLEAFLVQ